MRAVVVAGGRLGLSRSRLSSLLRGADLVVAADGGAARLHAAGYLPHAVVGDLDSLDPDTRRALAAHGVTFDVHPREKDKTDLELALLLAAERGATKIDVLGTLGGPRQDHAAGNLLLLTHPTLAGLNVTMLDARHQFFVLSGGGTRDVHGAAGDYVSLIPLSDPVEGIATTGLAYPLRDERLAMGPSRGISNELSAGRATIAVSSGRLLVAVHHRPRRRAAFQAENRPSQNRSQPPAAPAANSDA
jgi:thiamine pyrophosphokinase